MKQEDVTKQLKDPFPAKGIEWKLLNTTTDNARGLAVPYVESSAIQKRLDTTFGIFGWQNVYQPSWQEKSQICGISIYCEERKEWTTKFDGAENTDYEPIKGGLSDAFKRAASLWGIGRYLNDIKGLWVDIEPHGKSFAIKQDQYGILDTEYNNAIAKIFNTSAPQAHTPVTANQQPAAPSTDTEKQTSTPTPCDYKVQSVKPSGKGSSLLELVSNGGQIVTAYVKNSEQAVAAGSCLQKVEMVEKHSSYGKYNLINSYELAA